MWLTMCAPLLYRRVENVGRGGVVGDCPFQDVALGQQRLHVKGNERVLGEGRRDLRHDRRAE